MSPDITDITDTDHVSLAGTLTLDVPSIRVRLALHEYRRRVDIGLQHALFHRDSYQPARHGAVTKVIDEAVSSWAVDHGDELRRAVRSQLEALDLVELAGALDIEGMVVSVMTDVAHSVVLERLGGDP